MKTTINQYEECERSTHRYTWFINNVLVTSTGRERTNIIRKNVSVYNMAQLIRMNIRSATY